MNVELKGYTGLFNVIEAIRTCWNTQDKSDTVISFGCINLNIGPNDKKLIRKIIKAGHESTLEHSLITFKLSGISRAVLQEISRHRVGVSPSVESTRYTFRKFLKTDDISDFLVNSGDKDIDRLNIEHMKKIKDVVLKKQLPNDVAKYGIVESYKLTEIISFNLRSLRHFVKLRTSPKALKEIQDIANNMIKQLPEELSIFFEDLIKE